ncbi:hypothetical protein [Streptomyces sp. NPDC048637]|uniref:hypothetical protein n=1 Tax=Streptomyces sp. NPDC048637 TaxID=3155636 RepID=UPI003440665A
MAKEVIELVRCDRCGTEDDVEGFTIIRDGEPKDVDLCGTHKGPLVELYDLGAEQEAPRRRSGKGARTSHAVVAIEDWAPSTAAAPEAATVEAPETATVETPKAATSDAAAELIEAAKPLMGGVKLSAKVVMALMSLREAVESGRSMERAQAEVLALNANRIKVPDSKQGRRLRAALIAYQEQERRDA